LLVGLVGVGARLWFAVILEESFESEGASGSLLSAVTGLVRLLPVFLAGLPPYSGLSGIIWFEWYWTSK